MSCLSVTFERKGGSSVTLDRVGESELTMRRIGKLTVGFGLVCGTDIGSQKYILSASDFVLLTDDNYLLEVDNR